MDIGRNDPCPCKSGKKYKKCCETKNEAKEREALEKQWAAAAKKKEQENKEAEKQQEGKPAQAHHNPQGPAITVHKHQTVTTPKYSMPRKSGGG
ncbi:MAG: SEC-C metal-binding domain-containing protein [Elusimicrobiota bacterium]|jgi:hypothetical protein